MIIVSNQIKVWIGIQGLDARIGSEYNCPESLIM